LLKPTGRWSAEDTALYVSQDSSLFKKLRETWSKVYFPEAFSWIRGQRVNNAA
jgi:hypothetical protein